MIVVAMMVMWLAIVVIYGRSDVGCDEVGDKDENDDGDIW